MRLDAVPTVWAPVHDRARRALVRAERSLAFQMRRTIAACVAEQADLEAMDPVRAAQSASLAMMRRLPAVILRGRHAARIGSARALDAELRLARRLTRLEIPSASLALTLRDDEVRAFEAARSYAAAWLKAALAAIDDQPAQDRL